MRRFLIKVFVFVALQVAILAVLLLFHDASGEANYLAETIRKHERLRNTPSPKLIIAGGSNVPFGIHSPTLEKALGRPVVNMGLIAGMGLDFMLSEVRGSLHRGDWVLLSVEYDRLAGGFNPAIVSQLIQYRPGNILYLKPRHFRRVVLDEGLLILGGIVRRIPNREQTAESKGTETSIRGFNRWGDLTFHYNEPARIEISEVEGGSTFPNARRYPSESALKTLVEFSEACHKLGVKVFFSFPPQPGPTLDRARTAVMQTAAALNSVPYMTMIDSPFEQTYDGRLFFDTGYHLGREGGEERTQRILRALRAHLAAVK